ncbi:MAG: hypothetical protein E7615_00645 [Ruminococcaceae bacterium]|nr:hypothetical protein [Oscillospiraceae bacterium]
MKLNIREITLFAMLGSLMYASKLAMEVLPNIHLVGVFIVSITVVYRAKALYPIYIFVLMQGVFAGFNMWWIPYLYIWTVLWAIVMLLPKKMHPTVAMIVYMLVCGIHGFLFGLLYMPAQAVMFSLTFEKAVAWWVAGIPFDITHGIGNLVFGVLILPLIKAMRLARKYTR